MDFIPSKYVNYDSSTTTILINEMLGEIRDFYYFSIKKSIIDYVLKSEEERQRLSIN
jgi:hypothetical protein